MSNTSKRASAQREGRTRDAPRQLTSCSCSILDTGQLGKEHLNVRNVKGAALALRVGCGLLAGAAGCGLRPRRRTSAGGN